MIARILITVTPLVATRVLCGQCQYEVTQVIGNPCSFGVPLMAATDMNNNDEVVGRVACLGGVDSAWIWNGEFMLVNLPAVTAAFEGISDVGHLCGYMRPPGEDSTGFAIIDDELHVLQLPKGMNNARALSINDQGVSVGWWGNFITGDPAREAFIWSRGEAVGLNKRLGVSLSEAHDVNTHGIVAGSVGSQEDQRAFIFDRGEARMLPPIPGGLSSNALAINEWGDVVGEGRVPPTKPGAVDLAAFVYIDGSFVVIEAPSPFNRAIAQDINRFRQVVGRFCIAGTTAHTFVWQHGKVRLLNDLLAEPLIIPISSPCCIDDRGQILIANRHPAPSDFAYLLLSPKGRPVGDIDIDCTVDQHDLVFLLRRWGTADRAADLDEDGIVGFADLTILLGNWG